MWIEADHDMPDLAEQTRSFGKNPCKERFLGML
jgi:hypothetical protein